ncbi:MAG: NUDIX hydrolase [Polyangiaceae bacterium]|nr:NUDIX hydrolase [Polyangiaceae bacterium]
MTEPPAPARPSATVVLLREAAAGPEVLLLKRNDRIVFHGGEWVFPGGRVESGDADGDVFAIDAARRAAVRETREEADVEISAADVVPIAHWTTPLHMPKRFSTWFFAVRVPRLEVAVDGGEIMAHRWVAPEQALRARASGEIGLPPPTFLTLLELAAFPSAEAYLEAAGVREPVRFFPRYREVLGGPCSLLEGDVAYEGAPLEAEGPRHRIWLPSGGEWRYERRS